MSLYWVALIMNCYILFLLLFVLVKTASFCSLLSIPVTFCPHTVALLCTHTVSECRQNVASCRHSVWTGGEHTHTVAKRLHHVRPSPFVGSREFVVRFPVTTVWKKKNVSPPYTPKTHGRPRTSRVWLSYPVSGGQCHFTHLTILRRFSWPNLACMCTKVV